MSIVNYWIRYQSATAHLQHIRTLKIYLEVIRGKICGFDILSPKVLSLLLRSYGRHMQMPNGDDILSFKGSSRRPDSFKVTNAVMANLRISFLRMLWDDCF